MDLGPLLPSVAVAIPRMYPVTYLDLRSQLGAEQERLQMVHVEEHIRCAHQVAALGGVMDLVTKFERLRRWATLVEDRRLRLALQAGFQLLKAELHFREGIERYEGLAWPHLTRHLFCKSECYYRKELR